jgi:enoyl-CoA hydratase/carnithine racemase
MASMESKFATPGVKIGLFCSTPMVPVSRAIGRKRALEMLLTGRVIDAETAAKWGLINRAVTREELQIATRALALEIANASPFTLGLGKRTFYDQIDLSEADAYALTKEVMSRNATEADAQEGMTAFLEKRKPVWRQGASR